MVQFTVPETTIPMPMLMGVSCQFTIFQGVEPTVFVPTWIAPVVAALVATRVTVRKLWLVWTEAPADPATASWIAAPFCVAPNTVKVCPTSLAACVMRTCLWVSRTTGVETRVRFPAPAGVWLVAMTLAELPVRVLVRYRGLISASYYFWPIPGYFLWTAARTLAF